MRAFSKVCTECHVVFYCGGLTCSCVEKEIIHMTCYCIKCSLKSDVECLKTNIKTCPKANNQEDVLPSLIIEEL